MIRSLATAALAATLVLLCDRSMARAQELEAQVFAGIPADQATIGVNAGLTLGDRAVLLSGIRAGLLDMGIADTEDRASYQLWFVAVPLELKLYTRDPAPHTVVPTVRIGTAYQISRDRPKAGSLFTNAPTRVHTINGVVLLGASYFVDEHLGISVEAGMTIRRDFIDTSDPGAPDGIRIVALSWRAGLVLRL